jgi:hypothetical protein
MELHTMARFDISDVEFSKYTTFRQLISNYNYRQPNIVAKCLAFLFCVREAPGLNLGVKPV